MMKAAKKLTNLYQYICFYKIFFYVFFSVLFFQTSILCVYVRLAFYFAFLLTLTAKKKTKSVIEKQKIIRKI